MPNKYTNSSSGNVRLVLIVVVVLVVFGLVAFATGAAKFSIKVNTTPDASNSQKADTVSDTSNLASQPINKDETVLYENNEYDFSLKYPERWSVKKGTSSDPVVVFSTPKESADDKFVDNFFVTVTDLSSKPGLTSSEVMSAWIKENKAGSYGATFDAVSQTPTTVDGSDAEQLTYTFAVSGIDIKAMMTIVMKNNKAYLLSYTAEASTFSTYSTELTGIIDSFVFKR